MQIGIHIPRRHSATSECRGCGETQQGHTSRLPVGVSRPAQASCSRAKGSINSKGGKQWVKQGYHLQGSGLKVPALLIAAAILWPSLEATTALLSAVDNATALLSAVDNATALLS
jgi:hypothetical protein